MPYIKQEFRGELDGCIDLLASQIENVGELNYAVSSLCMRAMKPERYVDFNAIMGVLACVEREFYRRAVAPYEDRCIERNGDIRDYERSTK